MAETAGWQGFLGYKAGAVTGTKGDYTAVAAITSATLSYQGDVLDISALDDQTGMRVFLGGLGGGSISLDGFYYDGNTPQDALRTASGIIGSGRVAVSMAICPDGTNGYAGSFWVESFEMGPSVDGVATFSATLRMSGAATSV